MADRLGVEPGDCLFLDDNEANVLAAREAGMRAEVFRDPAQVRELLAACRLAWPSYAQPVQRSTVRAMTGPSGGASRYCR